MRTRTPRTAVVATVLCLTIGAFAAPVAAGTDEEPTDTEVGVTADEIRIAVIADDENPLAPGLFAASPAAVNAFAEYINDRGGLAGREVVVDVIDSHLSADDARNAIITACAEDFAIVGTAALFLNNMDDAISCVDKAGAATGIPDLAIVTTELVQQCSPVTFGVNPSQIDCTTKDATPQTFRANQGPIKYYERATGDDLHGVFVYSNDLKSAAVGGLTLARGAQSGGVKSDAETGISSRAPQSAYTPVVQQMKDSGSNYALNSGPFNAMVSLRKEAKLQGVDTDSVVWDCFSNCYDHQLIEQGGADVEGQYATINHLPFTEAKQNKALAAYLQGVGEDEATGFGAYAWLAGLLFRDAVNNIVERDGVNGLTRAALLEELANIHDFTGDGMWGETDVGNHVPTGCFVLTQVQDGEFVRVHPKKPGTFDCKKSNRIEIQEDLFGT
jgi:ABC-type branched-subunit amino acid transport system substrate-binding protein